MQTRLLLELANVGRIRPRLPLYWGLQLQLAVVDVGGKLNICGIWTLPLSHLKPLIGVSNYEVLFVILRSHGSYSFVGTGEDVVDHQRSSLFYGSAFHKCILFI